MFVIALGFCVAHSILENLLHKSVNARRDANYALTIFGQRKVLELVGISWVYAPPQPEQLNNPANRFCHLGASLMHVYGHADE